MNKPDLSAFNKFVKKKIIPRKSDEFIIKYLTPYTQLEGRFYHRQVYFFYEYDHLKVQIDMNKNTTKVKSYLRKQGFINVDGLYIRQKDIKMLECPHCRKTFQPTHKGNYTLHIKFKHP
jgi:hypothetical protein